MNSENKNDSSLEVGEDKKSSSSLEVKEDGRREEPTRIQLSEAQLEISSAGELRTLWRKQDIYLDFIENNFKIMEGKLKAITASEEKFKQQISDLTLKERILIRRLAVKEHEMQEYVNELSDMKASQNPSNLRNCLLDPTVNLLIEKLRQENSSLRTKLEDTQNELTAWKFTPDSNTGKRLMAKCRLLYQENEDLGKEIASGRLAKLEGDLALQKGFCEEVKKSQSEIDELLQDLDEDVEGMQSSIYYLQQELRRIKEGGNVGVSSGVTGDDGENLRDASQSLQQQRHLDEPASPTAATGHMHHAPVSNGHPNGDSVVTIVSDRKRTATPPTSAASPTAGDCLPLVKRPNLTIPPSPPSPRQAIMTNGSVPSPPPPR